jgi:hypothetical protein
MLRKITGFYRKNFLHLSVVTLLYLHNPAHAGHFQKILPPAFMKKVQREQGQEKKGKETRGQEKKHISEKQENIVKEKSYKNPNRKNRKT